MQTTTTPRAPRSRRGFTLIELIVVVIIIAVLAAIGAVAYNQYASKARTNAVLASATDLRAAIDARAAQDDTSTDAVVAAAWGTPSDAGAGTAAVTAALAASYTGQLTYAPGDGAAAGTLDVAAPSGNEHACILLTAAATAEALVRTGSCTDVLAGLGESPSWPGSAPVNGTVPSAPAPASLCTSDGSTSAAPPAPAMPIDGSTAGLVAISWTAVTGASSYVVYRDGAALTAVTGTAYTVPSPGTGLHRYQVSACAVSGQESPPSTPLFDSATPVSVTDDFNRPDANDLTTTSDGTQTWQQFPVGSWSISSNTLVKHTGMVMVNLGSGDQDVKIGTLAVAANTGLEFRVRDTKNYWILRSSNGTGTLWLCQNGGASQIASFSLGRTNVEVKAVGTTITVYNNGTAVKSITSSVLVNATKAGPWSGYDGGTFDDFSASGL